MTNLLLIGGGRGGVGILEMCSKVSDVKICGVVDSKSDALAMNIAKKMGIPTFTDIRDGLKVTGLNLVINITGDMEINRLVDQYKSPEIKY